MGVSNSRNIKKETCINEEPMSLDEINQDNILNKILIIIINWIMNLKI